MACLSAVNSSNACKVAVGIEGLQRIAVKSGWTKGGGSVGHSKGKLAARSVRATLTIIHANTMKLTCSTALRLIRNCDKSDTPAPRLTQISPAYSVANTL